MCDVLEWENFRITKKIQKWIYKFNTTKIEIRDFKELDPFILKFRSKRWGKAQKELKKDEEEQGMTCLTRY